MKRTLSALLLAASMLAGACTNSTRATHEPVSDPFVRPVKQVDRAKVRAALAARRQVVFERFLAYREGRVYPVNDASGFEHVWLDVNGNLCAAATLISADWGRDAAANVAAEDNHVALANIHDGALAEWMMTSGLTHLEIVSIQKPGFRPNPDEEQLRKPDPRAAEIQRLYDGYVDVERQLTSMWDESLDAATDALMKRPDLARQLIRGVAAGPGKYRAEAVATAWFAQPPG